MHVGVNAKTAPEAGIVMSTNVCHNHGHGYDTVLPSK